MNLSNRSIFYIGILVLVCVIPMFQVGKDLLSLRSIFELYPILFLPLFVRFESDRENSNWNPSFKKTQNIIKIESLMQYSKILESSISKKIRFEVNFRRRIGWFLPGTIFVISGIFFQRFSLIWIGSFWNALAVFHLSGITFAWPAPFLVFAIPPITGFGSLFLGYKLRLSITELCVQLIQFLDSNALAVGNQIFFHGEWFVVDRVCEGMKMGLASILIAVAFISRANRIGAILISSFVLPLWFFPIFSEFVSWFFFKYRPVLGGTNLSESYFLFAESLFHWLSFPCCSRIGSKANSIFRI
ncbi:hypothetical protein LEP1GSC043_2038 [Leptospira weilii str. Ecochallenge]|uniref:Uncharacterized protein n=1 Tax=Leptospira weilii str. Ecochallenge TaxID=1049986 RepID=N1U5Q4_9LEPT|nr:hypothetical protein LEP1GSC043_2038 [Leptospira weilii str. Ecochallenge]